MGSAAVMVLGPLGAAEAESICGGLKTILRNAPKKFVAVSQPAQGEETLKGKIVLGTLTNCEVRKSQLGATYQCMDHRIPPDVGLKIVAEIVADVEKCFGKDVTRSINQPMQVMFDYLPDSGISLDIGTTAKGGVVLTVDALGR